jgi:hypothetical protein
MPYLSPVDAKVAFVLFDTESSGALTAFHCPKGLFRKAQDYPNGLFAKTAKGAGWPGDAGKIVGKGVSRSLAKLVRRDI